MRLLNRLPTGFLFLLILFDLPAHHNTYSYSGEGCIISTTNHIGAQIKREFTGSYKEFFGKGPEETVVNVLEDVVVIKLEGFMTPMERTIQRLPGGTKKIEAIRSEIYKSFDAHLSSLVKRLIGIEPKKILNSLDLERDTEYIFIILEGVIKEVAG